MNKNVWEKQTQKLIGFHKKEEVEEVEGWTYNNNLSTCAGAARIPTPIPATMRPVSIIMWLCERAITTHPDINGKIENSNAIFLPHWFIMLPDTNDPIGVAAECIEADIGLSQINVRKTKQH